jgi:zinc-ribbon domain
MFCRKCGYELRPEARFCRRCGVPVVNRPARDDVNPRRTVNLPRDETPFRNTGFPVQGQNERPTTLPLEPLEPLAPPRNAPPVPPANRRPKRSDQDIAPDVAPDIAWMSARAQKELPPLPQTARAKTMLGKQLATTPISMSIGREPEAKPFFTQALTADKNPQHRRLVAVVPLLLLVVIVLFIFAYIAGR